MANIYQKTVKPQVFRDFEEGMLTRYAIAAKYGINWMTADRWYKEWQQKKKVAA